MTVHQLRAAMQQHDRYMLKSLTPCTRVQYVESWVEAGCIVCLLLELCESGDLLCQIKLRAPGALYFSEEMLQECAFQVSECTHRVRACVRACVVRIAIVRQLAMLACLPACIYFHDEQGFQMATTACLLSFSAAALGVSIPAHAPRRSQGRQVIECTHHSGRTTQAGRLWPGGQHACMHCATYAEGGRGSLACLHTCGAYRPDPSCGLAGSACRAIN